ncbi:hypothetical protein Hdeb2414_s0018g00516111 [Helianthus debilis subsp. tardiflorus]
MSRGDGYDWMDEEFTSHQERRLGNIVSKRMLNEPQKVWTVYNLPNDGRRQVIRSILHTLLHNITCILVHSKVDKIPSKLFQYVSSNFWYLHS